MHNGFPYAVAVHAADIDGDGDMDVLGGSYIGADVLLYENTAGDGFFERLDHLHAQRGRDHVTQIYFLCLALGFQGKFRLGQQEGLAAVVEGVGNHVALAIGGGELLAPNAERRDGGAGAVRRELPFLAIALGFFVLALLVVIVLRLVIGSNASAVADGIRALRALSETGAELHGASPYIRQLLLEADK